MTTEQAEVAAVIQRLNGRAWGVAFGLVCAGVLFLATNFLVWSGGPDAGQHLQLLAVFFPGYSVSFPGSLIGAVYGFVVGYGFGRVIGTVYNKLTEYRL